MFTGYTARALRKIAGKRKVLRYSWYNKRELALVLKEGDAEYRRSHAMGDYSIRLTARKLRDIAREQNVPYYARYKKPDLARLLGFVEEDEEVEEENGSLPVSPQHPPNINRSDSREEASVEEEEEEEEGGINDLAVDEISQMSPMVSAMEDRPLPPSDGPVMSSQEKILVTVRVRPLTPKEASSEDCSAWVCNDNRSIVSRDKESEIYYFDKVFHESCQDKEIYEDGARTVALSAMKGINATIIAYGQSGSGKTFTMNGITENVINDIYAHTSKTVESKFVMKFSAIEIYNENIVDLIHVGPPLCVFDDPEKGTYVKDLTEKVVKDAQHLRDMIAACVGKRKVCKTSLNKRSSRSHQILKLSIESSPRDASRGVRRSSLSLVDLAGSEHAAHGVRLREGRTINKSLLTFRQVINMLRNGGKRDHLPYRDSKLTRVLKSSLGGDSRTAIICTLSSASGHVAQSRETLDFGCREKRVTNRAQVNTVVPAEQSMDRLRYQVTKLKAELTKQKLVNQKLQREISQLKRKRDLAPELVDSSSRQFKKRKRIKGG